MLETKDLILKQGSAQDWKSLYKNLWSQSAAFQYMFAKACAGELSGEKKTAAYAEMHKAVNTEYFVYEKQSDEAIGVAGLKELQPGIFTVTDIAIGPAFWGRRYGTQILKVLLNTAFSEWGAKEVWYDCFSQNAVSSHLALSCGFVYDHSEEAELKKDGETIILDYYKLVR